MPGDTAVAELLYEHYGPSKRDFLAAVAMNALLQGQALPQMRTIARDAYRMADAMLSESEGKEAGYYEKRAEG